MRYSHTGGRVHDDPLVLEDMARTADAIIDEVMALPEGERARVVDVDALIEAVVASELERDPAFVAELRRRADAALSGETEGTPWRGVT